jgi:small subunit ribosomal protein S15
MAKKYSGSKGKAKSTKPSDDSVKSWVRYSEKEVELLVIKLAKKGLSLSKIGIELRDTYGIPSVKAITNKKINQILEAHNIKSDIPEDLHNLIKKFVAIQKHMAVNNHDKTAKRGYILTLSKIMRLTKYYKSVKKLSAKWKFQANNAILYV